jgi:hypothetical protein
MQNAAEDIRVDNLITPQDVAVAGTVNTNTGMYRSMKLYRKGVVVITAHLSNTKTAVAQLTQSTAATATSKDNVSGYTCTLTGTTAVPEQVGMIAFDVSALAADHYFVGVDITTDNNGDDVAAILIRRSARYLKGGPVATTGANAQDA